MAASASAQVASPVVTDIRIGRDTVSFYARRGPYDGDEYRVARFVRRTGEWLAGDDLERAVPRDMPDRVHPAKRLARGWQLVGRTLYPRADWYRTYAVREVASGRVYGLRASLSPRERWLATLARDSVGRGEYALWWDEPPTPCESPSRWAVDADAFWFACPSAGTGLGVVMRFDRRTHRVTTMSGAEIAGTGIVAIVTTPGALWLAGSADATSGLGGTGLFRYDVAMHAWSRVTIGGFDPGARPTALASSGDTLWVATPDGLAAYDAHRGTWTSRWFRAQLVVTDTVDDRGIESLEADHRFAPTADPPSAAESRTRLRIALVEQLVAESAPIGMDDSPRRWLDSVLARVDSLPDAHLDSALAHPDESFSRALADSGLIALATADWLDADSSLQRWSWDDLPAIGLLGDRRYAPLLRRIYDKGALPLADQIALAVDLARLSDTTGVPWIRRIAATDENWYDIDPATRALRELGDTAAGSLIAARFDEPGAREGDAPQLLLRAFARVATPTQWRALVGRLSRDGTLRLALLDGDPTIHSARVDSLVRSDSATRAAAIDIARRELAAPGEMGAVAEGKVGRWPAADIVLAVGDGGAVPYLIPLLTRSAGDYRLAVATLIQLTGVDSAPAWGKPTPAQREEQRRFWESWWRSMGSGFTPVPLDAGKAALRRWRIRVLGL